MQILHAHAAERDGTITPEPDLDPRARAILERIARAGYMIDRHREGIALNQQRILEAQAELERIEAQP